MGKDKTKNLQFAVIPQTLEYKSACICSIEFHNNRERDYFCTFLNIIGCKYLRRDCEILLYNEDTKESFAEITPMSAELFTTGPAVGTRLILDEYTKDGSFEMLVITY